MSDENIHEISVHLKEKWKRKTSTKENCDENLYIHEHKTIARLKRVIRNNVNVVDGYLVPELAFRIGVVVVFVVDISAVIEGLVVMDEELEETKETMGSGVTSSDVEFLAFKYEKPPPRSWASDPIFQLYCPIKGKEVMNPPTVIEVSSCSRIMSPGFLEPKSK